MCVCTIITFNLENPASGTCFQQGALILVNLKTRSDFLLAVMPTTAHAIICLLLA